MLSALVISFTLKKSAVPVPICLSLTGRLLDPNARGQIASQRPPSVNGRQSLEHWMERLERKNISHQGLESFSDRDILRFEDPEGQPSVLVEDHGASATQKISPGMGHSIKQDELS